jgi:hypothetical protein
MIEYRKSAEHLAWRVEIHTNSVPLDPQPNPVCFSVETYE